MAEQSGSLAGSPSSTGCERLPSPSSWSFTSPSTPVASAKGGWVGVDVFFVLSGFLITSLFIEESAAELTRRFSLGRFYLRRIFRLWPAYVAFILGALLYARLYQAAEFDLVAPPALDRCHLPDELLEHQSPAPRRPRADLDVVHGGAVLPALARRFAPAQPVALPEVVDRGHRLAGRTLHGRERRSSPHATSPTCGSTTPPDTNAYSLLLGCLFALMFSAGHFDRLMTRRFSRWFPFVFIAALLVWTHSVDGTKDLVLCRHPSR